MVVAGLFKELLATCQPATASKIKLIQMPVVLSCWRMVVTAIRGCPIISALSLAEIRWLPLRYAGRSCWTQYAGGWQQLAANQLSLGINPKVFNQGKRSWKFPRTLLEKAIQLSGPQRFCGLFNFQQDAKEEKSLPIISSSEVTRVLDFRLHFAEHDLIVKRCRWAKLHNPHQSAVPKAARASIWSTATLASIQELMGLDFIKLSGTDS